MIRPLVAACLVLLPTLALAATFQVRESLTIEAYVPGTGNLYALGESVRVDALIEEDLVVMGGDVAVVGGVAHDLLALSGELTLTGPLAEDVRAAAGRVYLNAPVSGDLLLAAGDLATGASTTVSGPARIVGQRVELDGVWEGDVAVAASHLVLSGEFRGVVTARVGDTLTIAPTARFSAPVVYRAPEEATMPEGVLRERATVEFTKYERPFTQEQLTAVLVAIGTGLLIYSIFTYLLTSVLLVALFPGFAGRVVRYILKRPGQSVGVGALSLLGLFFGGVVLILSLIGVVVGLSVWLLLVGLSTLASFLSASLAGALLSQWVVKRTVVSWQWTLLGGVVLILIDLVPYLGPLTNFLLWLAVMGSITRGLYEYWWKGRNTGVLHE